VYRDDRDTKGGGTAIAITANMTSRRWLLPDLKHLEATAVDVDTNIGTLRIISVYLAPGKRFIPEDLEAIFDSQFPFSCLEISMLNTRIGTRG
jgi:hypothetical protein